MYSLDQAIRLSSAEARTPTTNHTGDPWPVVTGIEIVDEEGLEAVSIRAVAARAGYTPMAVYRHVEDADALLFVERHGIGTHSFPEGLRESPATTFQILIEAVDEAMDAGALEADDPVEMALFFWSTAHGLITLHRSGRLRDDDAFTAFYDRSLARLLRTAEAREGWP